MASTRQRLDLAAAHLDESLGVRSGDARPQLSPIPSGKDAGRRPLRNIGRVDVDRVIPDPEQPRLEFSEEAIDRLAASIREKGQLSAIRVRWSEPQQKWVIIAGERRWRATRRAGLPTIDCYFHDDHLSRSEILEQQLIENLLREDLRPVEQAQAFADLMRLNDWTAKQVAEALRVQPSTVSRSMALLKLPEDIRQQVDSGEVSARAAYEMSKLSGDEARRRLASKAQAGQLTHESVAAAVRQHRGKPRPTRRGTRQTFVTEEGWKITVTSRRQGTYHDIEQALNIALAEVRHRIRNHLTLF